MKARVFVTLRDGILDPAGTAVRGALEGLGFGEVRDVRIGRLIEMRLDGVEPEAVEPRVREMCERLLANAVMEDFSFELEGE